MKDNTLEDRYKRILLGPHHKSSLSFEQLWNLLDDPRLEDRVLRILHANPGGLTDEEVFDFLLAEEERNQKIENTDV